MGEPSGFKPFIPVIKVIGVGGGGGNVIAHMVRCGITGAELIAANTDQQALRRSRAPVCALLGPETTRGRGAGSLVKVGERCALESEPMLGRLLKGAAMVFIAAGLGGGTGTGASPVIARIAKGLGALTVAVVTLPFSFEGKRRRNAALAGLDALKAQADMVLVIPNDRLVDVSPKEISLLHAFARADDVLREIIQGITELITHRGFINVDFSDVRTIMENKGDGVIGRGRAAGENRVVEATGEALRNPLMGDVSIRGAKGVLVHFMSREALALVEMEEAMSRINQETGEGANVIMGATVDERMDDSVAVMLIATGIEAPFSPGAGATT
ncbi:MAG: cell division protein FtsZ [Candidatus Lambdaproteobacteria bacterium]|nr:cell division protein FtsZ [Candidatus Lambdaproteobacteria bacterium]